MRQERLRRVQRRDFQIHGRADMADIADITGTGGRGGFLFGQGRNEALLAQMAFRKLLQDRQMHDIVHRKLRIFDFQFRAGHQLGALGDVEHLFHQLIGVAAFGRADIEQSGSAVRHRVRYIAAMRDHTVDPGVRTDMLPQRVHAGKDQLHRVQRVDTVPWRDRSMRCLSFVMELQGGQRQSVCADRGAAFQMCLQAQVDVIHPVTCGHFHLSSVAFLCRCADQQHLRVNICLFADLRKRDRRACRNGRDPVMAAGMRVVFIRSVTRKRIVFRQERDLRSLGAFRCAKGGLETAVRVFDRKPLSLHIFHQTPGRLKFLHADLGKVQDLAMDLFKFFLMLPFDLCGQRF